MKTRIIAPVPMFIAGIIFPLFMAGTAMAAIIEVDTPAGGFTALGTCDPAVINDCSLEDAVALANKDALPDSIVFNIIGFFPFWTINISAPIVITEPVTIDGYNGPWTAKPNTVPAPGLTDAVLSITIDGSGLKLTDNCFDINTTTAGAPVLIKGLVINNCPVHGISLQGSNVTIQGNYIGTDRTGIIATPNVGDGIYVDKAHDILIGGPNPEHRNVISGNAGSGIVFTDAVNGSDIEGNFIGLDATGTAALGNGNFGILMGSNKSPGTISGNNIGNGPSDVGDGKRNYIGGNATTGIYVAGTWTTKLFGWVQIDNNYIGTDVFGTAAIPNAKGGIDVVISDDARIENNLISGNTGNGVSVTGDDTLIPGGVGSYRISVFSNKIGTDASGLNPLGNTGTGVLFHNGTNRSYVGDAGYPGSGNIIAYNTLAGVTILEENPPFTTDDNKIQMNSIFGNGGIGIDLASDGVTLNDANDADFGANRLQNYPIVDSVSYAGGNTTITASLNSIISRGPYRFEFFANDAADPTGYGEGQTYLGGVDGIFTDALGNATVPFVVAGDYTSKYITATVTDTSQYTSEFGPMRDADLSVAKTASAAAAEENDIVTFTITVSNITGPSNTTGVEVTDLIGGGLVYLNHSASQGTYNSSTGVWSVGALAFGGTATLSIDAYVDNCGNLANTANITAAGQYDPVSADNTATATVTVTCPPVAGGRPEGYTDNNGTDSPAMATDTSDDSSGDEGEKNEPSDDTQDTGDEEAVSSSSAAAPQDAGGPDSPKYCPGFDFNPADSGAVTRYEFIKYMLELTCHDIPAQIPDGEKSYADYPRTGSYNENLTAVLAALYYATDNGIVSGYPDGTIKPYDPVNYAEAAKILYAAAGVSDDQYQSALSRVTFNFFGTEWYLRYFIFMMDLAGTTNLDPSANVSADETGSLADRLMEKYPD